MNAKKKLMNAVTNGLFLVSAAIACDFLYNGWNTFYDYLPLFYKCDTMW